MAKQSKERRRPSGYWHKWANVVRELRAWIKTHGHFPTCEELKHSRHISLAWAISKFHGGFITARKRLGYETHQERPGFWLEWRNIEKAVRVIIAQLGHFPTQHELAELGKSGLIHAVTRHHGGLNAIRGRMGCTPRDEKPAGYWQDWKNFSRELRAIVNRLGHLPRRDELIQLKKSSLAWAVKFHGGMHAVRQKLGYNQARVVNGYYADFANVQRELEEIAEHLGQFPGDKDFKRLGKSGLAYAIQRQHGGLYAVKIKMGYTPATRKWGEWKKWTTVEQEIQAVITKLGHFPSQSELIALDNQALVAAIAKYHGGLNAVRARLGYTPRNEKPRRYWREWSHVESELQQWIATHGHFPTQRELRSTGHKTLAVIITKYHGGFPAVRRQMGYEVVQESPGFWKAWKKVERELFVIIEKLGHFPTQCDLNGLNRSDLSHAIMRYHGGFAAVRARLGYGRPIYNTSGFVRVLEREQPQKSRQVLRDLMSHFGDDLVDVADILAVVYTGRLDSQTAMEILQDPTMRPWIVPFDGRGHGPGKPPIGDDFPFYLLEKDKNGVIAGIIRRRLTEWRRKVLGARPSKEARERFLRELRAMQERLAKGGNQVALAAE